MKTAKNKQPSKTTRVRTSRPTGTLACVKSVWDLAFRHQSRTPALPVRVLRTLARSSVAAAAAGALVILIKVGTGRLLNTDEISILIGIIRVGIVGFLVREIVRLFEGDTGGATSDGSGP